MSSTNRGYDRHKSDYYITPQQPIHDFLEYFHEEGLGGDVDIILDPCAGGDEENQMAYPTALSDYYKNIKTIDIREDSKAEVITNYLEHELDYKPNMIITNPPFNIAKDIINKAMNDVADNGYVIMLLRLNFFGSKDRREFFRDNMPTHCFVHHRRISFTNGATDSIEYAHFVWRKGVVQNHTKLILI